MKGIVTQKKIKIAYVLKSMTINGISTVVMNYCRNIDRKRFEITIFSGEPIDDTYVNECAELGVNLVKLSEKTTNPLNYYLKLWNKLSKRSFDIIHVHGNSATITIELLLAFFKGIKVRVAHSHNSTCKSKKAHKLLLPLFKRIYTNGFACSNLAGKWLFEDRKFEVLPNGFNTKKFIFNDKMRSSVRRDLEFNDKFVVGHIGRFNGQKNHPFILDVFEEIAKEREDAVLLLVGEGPDYEKTKQLISLHPYKEKIKCYGNTTSPEHLYNAMDVFLFPSKFEGLGIVLIEAQINGLRCVTSDVVPREVNVCNRVDFLSLDDSVEVWKNAVLKNDNSPRSEFYEKYKSNIESYEIKKNADSLCQRYYQMMNI